MRAAEHYKHRTWITVLVQALAGLLVLGVGGWLIWEAWAPLASLMDHGGKGDIVSDIATPFSVLTFIRVAAVLILGVAFVVFGIGFLLVTPLTFIQRRNNAS